MKFFSATAIITFAISILAWPVPIAPPGAHFEWAVVGDSWTAGVAYSSKTAYRKTDFNFCYRATEAWGAQMEADNTWTEHPQRFHFAACGGSLIRDVRWQLKGIAGKPQLVLGTFGGNNANFGDIARSCIYQPWSARWGPPFHEDRSPISPKSKGQCKQNIAKAQTYIETDLRKDFTDGINDVFEFAQRPDQSLPNFHLYVSSYVEFFNANTDKCNNWSFGSVYSKNRPKLVKKLRVLMNSLVEQFNKVQADVINSYKAPRNYHVGYINASPTFEGHRFCEPGHSFSDQYYNRDVWMWNLQFFDKKKLFNVVMEPQTTPDGVTFMPLPAIDANGTVVSLGTNSSRATSDMDLHSHSGFGWTARPFHPKHSGHRAMKNLFIQRLRRDRVPGVV
ncbi:hypothetical protein AJ79_05472 [Helicocarpus griseus UAMH5409]|uniref:SGNH hydrolase-type esterase domain-containing protein n=1 Tax=Helicocarpus griseus UAMH5409 TaxID=1447875 RepID=A0A2B7XNU7_9EURO|nr:hypothetical protein AJ79_05472 [Helicocarpus griseus UAMH5409]